MEDPQTLGKAAATSAPVSGPPLALRMTRRGLQDGRPADPRQGSSDQRPAVFVGIGGWPLEIEGSAADVLSHLLGKSSAVSGVKAMADAVGLAIQGTVVGAIASSKFKALGPNTPRTLVRHAVSSVRFSSVGRTLSAARRFAVCSPKRCSVAILAQGVRGPGARLGLAASWALPKTGLVFPCPRALACLRPRLPLATARPTSGRSRRRQVAKAGLGRQGVPGDRQRAHGPRHPPRQRVGVPALPRNYARLGAQTLRPA
jgi:hypothetical protein